MRIREETARKLLLALGYENARTYSEAMLVKRLSEIETKVPQDRLLGIKDDELMPSLKAVIGSAKRKEQIVIVAAKMPIVQVRQELKEMGISTAAAEKKVLDVVHATRNTMENLKDPEPVASVSEINPVAEEPKKEKKPKSAAQTANHERFKRMIYVRTKMKHERQSAEVYGELNSPEALFRKNFPERAEAADRAMEIDRARREAKEKARKDMADLIPVPKKARKVYYVKKVYENEFPNLADTPRRPHKKWTVLRAIFDALHDASQDDPVSKDDVMEVVERKFPDGKKSSMWVSVNAFPTWLEIHYPFKLQKVGKDKYYLTPKEKK